MVFCSWCWCSRTFLSSLCLLLDLPQPLHQLVLLSLYPLLLFLRVLALLLLVLQLRSAEMMEEEEEKKAVTHARTHRALTRYLGIM